MSWTWGDDERADFELSEKGWRDGVVADDSDGCSEQRKLLVEIPGKGIEVVYHQHIELAFQRRGECRGRHCAPSGPGLAGARLEANSTVLPPSGPVGHHDQHDQRDSGEMLHADSPVAAVSVPERQHRHPRFAVFSFVLPQVFNISPVHHVGIARIANTSILILARSAGSYLASSPSLQLSHQHG